MTRTKARELAIRLIYAQGASGEQPEDLLGGFFEDEHFATLADEDELFGKKPDEESLGYIRTLVSLCAANHKEIDSYIEKYAIGWRPERITRTAAAVLRCALAELLYVEVVPPSAVINEAVELAKNYEEPETVAFIIGVLGGFMRGERAAAPEES